MEKTLQDICREAKEYQHLTTQDLADLTDLSSSTISNYFSAASKDPSLYKMGLICAALGVSIDEYFGIVKRPTTEEQLAEEIDKCNDAVEEQWPMQMQSIAQPYALRTWRAAWSS